MKTNKKIKILEAGLKQRKILLNRIQKQIINYEQQSDFGWMLTMGGQEFGMLMAIDSTKKYRDAQKVQTKLKEEINIIAQSIEKLSLTTN